MSRVARLAFGSFAASAASIAIACGSCWKDVVSEEEFDRRAWDESSIVIAVTVTSAELDGSVSEGRANTIRYAYVVQEVFKGTVIEAVQVSSQRMIDEWNSEIASIGCGEYVVVPGDRLLLFSDGGLEIHLDRCSSSRLIESVLTDAAIDHNWRRTKERLKKWKE